ncbi:MAG TPA: glycosyltransferase [Gaiellaceae bacterium]|nr:glycosyltransferase [Gaiellaceae bacterium]
MVLGVDVSRLVGQRTGIGRAYEYLLRAWARQDELPFERIELYAPAPVDDVPDDPRFRLHVLPSRGPGLWWESVPMARLACRTDLLFSPYTLPVGFRGRCVVENWGILEGEHAVPPWQLRHRARNWHLAYSARRADAVVVVSGVVEEDLVRFYRVPRERITVVAPGISEHFRPARPSEDERDLVERVVGAPAPFLVFVGKLSPRRHLPELLEAFDRAAADHRDLRLLVVGPNTWNVPVDELAARLPAGERVRRVEHLDHGTLAALYRAAVALVLPTTKEGWSLPIREALACGCPVVTVDGPWLDLDGARQAVIALERPEVPLLERAIRGVVEDEGVRADLRRRGLACAASFPSHDERARTVIELLARVAAGGAAGRAG